MSSNAVSPSRPPLWPLMAAALVLALLPRLAIVFASRADMFGPGIGEVANTYIGEELTRGDVAMEVLRGPLLSLSDYQFADFFGGATVSGLFAVPFFALFGPKLWALKLSAIAFHLIALAFGIALVDRWVSRRAAMFFALLFAWTPPGYTLLSTVAWGAHVETGMLALICVWLFLDLRDLATDAPGRSHRRFTLGLCAGFAVWFSYVCVIFLAVILFFDAVFDRRIWKAREFGFQLAGALVGTLPWWIYNLRNDWSGLSIYGVPILDHLASAEKSGGFFERWFDLGARALPGGFFFDGFDAEGHGLWNALSMGALFALALAPWLLARRPHATPFLMAWSYLAVFSFAYAISDFEVGTPRDDIRTWRYVMVPIPFLALAAACGLDGIAARSASALRVAWLVAVLWAGSSFAGCLQFVDSSRAFADQGRLATSQDHFGRWMARRYGRDTAVLERLCTRIVELRSEDEQAEFFGGMASALRNVSRVRPNMAPQELAHAEAYDAGRVWLSEHAPAPFRALFQADPAGR